jgi:7,8-dihydropterin-6-yl-methyl-4-(beta-D-ribofuranosyl)aminobenzene 5'-phosphate synthase
MKLTVLYDNHSQTDNLVPDWGYSCLVQGLDKSILFDTGAKADILQANMNTLKIQPGNIDVVLLSHDHYDHTGGLDVLLRKKNKPEVWVTPGFSQNIKNIITEGDSRLVQAQNKKKICRGAYSTGEIQGWINEQSLVLESGQGTVILTGCAHPRIIKILNFVKENFSGTIQLVLGGFHLSAFDEGEIRKIIHSFRKLGVQKVGPCHCTGEEAKELFSREYGTDYLAVSAGFEIEIP